MDGAGITLRFRKTEEMNVGKTSLITARPTLHFNRHRFTDAR